MQAAEAQLRAADRLTVHQLEMIALPRRFSLPMQEIWLLQARFSQRKRVGRLLAHPRFRAAYDFLVLRQAASNEHAEEAQFWRDAQATMVEGDEAGVERSEEHTSKLQSLMRISYAVFCLKNKSARTTRHA